MVKRRTLRTKKKKIVYVDMDGVIADFDNALPDWVREQQLSDEEWDGFIDAHHYALHLNLIDGAKEALAWLDEYFEVYILSTPVWAAPNNWIDKRLWIEKHFPAFKKRLILSHHKNLCVGDYLIDDRIKNGAGKFTGKQILFGSLKFPNWSTVIDYLRKVENIKEENPLVSWVENEKRCTVAGK